MSFTLPRQKCLKIQHCHKKGVVHHQHKCAFYYTFVPLNNNTGTDFANDKPFVYWFSIISDIYIYFFFLHIKQRRYAHRQDGNKKLTVNYKESYLL